MHQDEETPTNTRKQTSIVQGIAQEYIQKTNHVSPMEKRTADTMMCGLLECPPAPAGIRAYLMLLSNKGESYTIITSSHFEQAGKGTNTSRHNVRSTQSQKQNNPQQSPGDACIGYSYSV